MSSLEQRCQKIELLLSDVDGVLTDGGVVFDNQGIETKQFNIRDGLGIKLWQRTGFRFGLITGRASHIVKLRAAELGIDLVRQGVEEKWPTVRQIIQELRLRPEQVCFIGDDLPDRPVMLNVGLGVAVADASEDVRNIANYVTTAVGGRGAVREVVELLLRTQRRWDELLGRYGGMRSEGRAVSSEGG